MNELLILRHAKSDWNTAAATDHERPLNQRGVAAAKKIGDFVGQADRRPDAVLCSTARRTRQTLDLAAQAGAWRPEVQFCDELYGADVATWLGVLARSAPATCRRLLVVGHEPTCSAVMQQLTGASVRFPTAALAAISIAQPWSEIRRASGELQWFLIPRLLA